MLLLWVAIVNLASLTAAENASCWPPTNEEKEHPTRPEWIVTCAQLTQTTAVYKLHKCRAETTDELIPIGEYRDIPLKKGVNDVLQYRQYCNGSTISADEFHWMRVTEGCVLNGKFLSFSASAVSVNGLERQCVKENTFIECKGDKARLCEEPSAALELHPDLKPLQGICQEFEGTLRFIPKSCIIGKTIVDRGDIFYSKLVGHSFICRSLEDGGLLIESVNDYLEEKCEDGKEMRDGLSYICNKGKWIVNACMLLMQDRDVKVELNTTFDVPAEYRYECKLLKLSNSYRYALIRTSCLDDDNNILKINQTRLNADGSRIMCSFIDGEVTRLVETREAQYKAGEKFVQNSILYQVENVNGNYVQHPIACIAQDATEMKVNSEKMNDDKSIEKCIYDINTATLTYKAYYDIGCKLKNNQVVPRDGIFVERKSLPDIDHHYSVNWICEEEKNKQFNLKPHSCDVGQEVSLKFGQAVQYRGKTFVCTLEISGLVHLLELSTEVAACKVFGKVYEHGTELTDVSNTTIYRCDKGAIIKTEGCKINDELVKYNHEVQSGDGIFVCTYSKTSVGSYIPIVRPLGCPYENGKIIQINEYKLVEGKGWQLCEYFPINGTISVRPLNDKEAACAQSRKRNHQNEKSKECIDANVHRYGKSYSPLSDSSYKIGVNTKTFPMNSTTRLFTSTISNYIQTEYRKVTESKNDITYEPHTYSSIEPRNLDEYNKATSTELHTSLKGHGKSTINPSIDPDKEKHPSKSTKPDKSKAPGKGLTTGPDEFEPLSTSATTGPSRYEAPGKNDTVGRDESEVSIGNGTTGPSRYEAPGKNDTVGPDEFESLSTSATTGPSRYEAPGKNDTVGPDEFESLSTSATTGPSRYEAPGKNDTVGRDESEVSIGNGTTGPSRYEAPGKKETVGRDESEVSIGNGTFVIFNKVDDDICNLLAPYCFDSIIDSFTSKLPRNWKLIRKSIYELLFIEISSDIIRLITDMREQMTEVKRILNGKHNNKAKTTVDGCLLLSC
uniref:Glycoprotein n=1 Tax=Heterorhabditis bacteriophora TaxID=37862 RepID=A0A1I7X456_HETBA